MVYAMFSIGILGFLVWSQMVALPHCEVRVKNIAICWNSLVLTSTFNSKNLVSYTQSAGNLYTKGLKSSSETTRETSLSYRLYKDDDIVQVPYTLYTIIIRLYLCSCLCILEQILWL